MALSIGRRDLADWLDWRIWSLPQRSLREADVPAAAMVGDTDAVRRLIDLGLPVDAIDAQAAPRCCVPPVVAIWRGGAFARSRRRPATRGQ
ncbi:hypothetical protein XPN_2032 [Xanthomonas arboricola pv. pruni MAFF 301427]|nr:hypothetical protein XPN_2032 [Xanthomonas arboricola pv. pruni MAFF 301427]